MFTVKYRYGRGAQKSHRHRKGEGPRPILLVSSPSSVNDANIRDLLSSTSSSSTVNKAGCLRMRHPIIFTPNAATFRRSKLGQALMGQQQKSEDEGYLPTTCEVKREGGYLPTTSCEVIECRGDASYPHRCDVQDCLARLRQLGYQRLMVEGGADIITSFLQEGLVDLVVVTASPSLMHGYKAIQPPPSTSSSSVTTGPWMTFSNWRIFRLGTDMIFFARPSSRKKERNEKTVQHR